MTTVIVQPDALAAWAGLVGVVVGGLLSIGGAWLQRRLTERGRRLKAVRDAADDLRSGAQNLMMASDASGEFGYTESALVSWLPVAFRELERVQKAAETIRRLSTPELAALARGVANEAIAYASKGEVPPPPGLWFRARRYARLRGRPATGRSAAQVTAAINAFSEAAAEAGF